MTVGISIKHDEIERLIRQLANTRRTTMVDAIGQAVRGALEREGETPMTDAEISRRLALVHEIQDEIRRDGIDWSLSEDEILGYDEEGIPEQPNLS